MSILTTQPDALATLAGSLQGIGLMVSVQDGAAAANAAATGC